MPLDKKDVSAGLLKKGFQNIGGDHWRYVYVTIDGKQTRVKTMISRGSYKQIADDTISNMKRQCKLDRNSEFFDLIQCPLRREDYEEILKNKGHCD